jgi:formylglycine-generating enzyme required for sulfatase activity
MVAIPGGESFMGDFWHDGAANERPAHVVFLAPYFVDLHEVTSQHYADGLNWALAQGGLIAVINGVVCKADGGTGYPYCDTTSSDAYSRITWSGAEFGVVAGKGNHPMVMVSWYGAAAYCNWKSAMHGREPCFELSTWACDFTKNGYRLPTEAEWEKAAGLASCHSNLSRLFPLRRKWRTRLLHPTDHRFPPLGRPLRRHPQRG